MSDVRCTIVLDRMYVVYRKYGDTSSRIDTKCVMSIAWAWAARSCVLRVAARRT